jgi:predicted CoA-binding protein
MCLARLPDNEGMTSMKAVEDFLRQKRIAVVGVSQRPEDFSRILFHALLERGYDAVPVNPAVQHVEGQRCFAHVMDISPPVEGVLLMTSPAVTDTVVRECAVAGIKRVWMYQAVGKGAVSADAVNFCESQGMSVIPGECPFMFLPDTAWMHRLHGAVLKMVGAYPV